MTYFWTDIVIPGANSTTDVQARISAGESVHVIRGSKGNYNNTLINLCIQSISLNHFHHLMWSITQVHTSGRTMAEFLRFDLERSVDQQEVALLLQEVEIHICTFLHSFASQPSKQLIKLGLASCALKAPNQDIWINSATQILAIVILICF